MDKQYVYKNIKNGKYQKFIKTSKLVPNIHCKIISTILVNSETSDLENADKYPTFIGVFNPFFNLSSIERSQYIRVLYKDEKKLIRKLKINNLNELYNSI